MARLNVELEGLDDIIDEFRGFQETVGDNVEKAVERTAHLVKENAQENASGSTYFPRIPYGVKYRVKRKRGSVSAEVEAVGRGKQAVFGAIREFGTATSPPRPFLGPALEASTEDFMRGLSRALADSMGG